MHANLSSILCACIISYVSVPMTRGMCELAIWNIAVLAVRLICKEVGWLSPAYINRVRKTSDDFMYTSQVENPSESSSIEAASLAATAWEVPPDSGSFSLDSPTSWLVSDKSNVKDRAVAFRVLQDDGNVKMLPYQQTRLAWMKNKITLQIVHLDHLNQ